MPTVESQLAALRPDEIEVRRALVLEWYDGPGAGFVELSKPTSTWCFQKLAERFDEDDADSRLYLLSAAAGDVIDQAALDKYSFAREIYLQRRRSLIGRDTAEKEERFDLPETAPDSAAPAAGTPVPAK